MINDTQQFKILIVGDCGVGKSSIMSLYIYNIFRKKHESTIGVNFLSKLIRIEEKNIKLQFWDTPGTESFRSLFRMYYQKSVIIIYVYDTTKIKSFKNIKIWLEDSLKYIPFNSFNKILIGNKIDLADQKEVDFEVAQNFANDNDMVFFECSCLIENSIKNTIEIIVLDTLHKIKNLKIITEKDNENILDINKNNNVLSKNSGCC